MSNPLFDPDFARTERGSRNGDEQFTYGMIHAYFDDSKDEKTKNFVCCGGIAGDAFTLSVIENMWWRATKHLKKPFHATDCESQFDEFKYWKKEDCTALIKSLVDVLCQKYAPVAAIGSVVRMEALHLFFPTATIDDAYRLSVRHMIITMAREARKNNERVKLWFEHGTADADVLRAYNDLRQLPGWDSNERDRLAGLTFGDKSMHLLQAADLVAREGMKAALNHGVRPIRIPVRRVWPNASINVWGEECLGILKANGGLDDLEALTKMDYRCYAHERRPNAPLEAFQ